MDPTSYLTENVSNVSCGNFIELPKTLKRNLKGINSRGLSAVWFTGSFTDWLAKYWQLVKAADVVWTWFHVKLVEISFLKSVKIKSNLNKVNRKSVWQQEKDLYEEELMVMRVFDFSLKHRLLSVWLVYWLVNWSVIPLCGSDWFRCGCSYLAVGRRGGLNLLGQRSADWIRSSLCRSG